MIDAWEHAFYLQYKNVKADYVKAIWNIVDWADVRSVANDRIIINAREADLDRTS